MNSIQIHQQQIKENIYKSFQKVEELEGGIADNMSLEDVAEYWSKKDKLKYNSTLRDLQIQLDLGLEEEREHTTSLEKRTELVLDHLKKNKEYYTELKKIEV